MSFKSNDSQQITLNDALSLYRHIKRLSSILGNIFSANGLVHDFSSMRFHGL